MEELKECPFCGGEVVLAHTNHRSLTNREHMFKCLKCGTLTFLQSKPCVCGTVEEIESEAAKLFNRRTAPENKPLTLEQLRQMGGKPVYVIHPNMKGWFEYDKEAGWYILEHFFGKGIGIKDSNMDTVLSGESSYGRDWIAFAQEPEQEEQNDKR